MGWNKRGEESSFGWGTIVMAVLIIAVGVLLFVIMRDSNEVGKTAFVRIKELFGFA